MNLPGGLVPGAPPTLFPFVGNRDFEAEELLALELGYRNQATDDLSLDLTAFYFDYDKLRSSEPTGPPLLAGGLTLVDLVSTNNGSGDSYGIEASFKYHPRSDWRLTATDSWIEIDVPLNDGSVIFESNEADSTSKYLASLHSSHDLSDTVDMDWAIYGVSATAQNIRYARADIRLAWQFSPEWNFSSVLQDAFDPRHTEGQSAFLTNVTDVERAAYVRLVWAP